MAEFLEVIESIEAEAVETRKIYNAADGQSIRGLSRRDPRYLQSLTEAARLVNDVRSGRRSAGLFREAMTTSDFPLLFGDILDRQMLASYADWPVVWPSIARRATVRDFRSVNRFTIDGGEAALTEVKERTEYPAAALTEGKYSYGLKKYGKRLPFDWEDFINDDLGALENSPARLAKSARVSEDRFITTLFAGNFGTGFFKAGNNNLVTANPVLSIAGLTTAFQILNAQVDTDGNPIYIDRVHLMVPPSLMVTAENIVNATQILAGTGGGAATGNDVLQVANWVKNKLDVQVNPWLPIIDSTQGNTAWYLFADPTASRPSMELGFLRGHETPEMFMKAPNATRVGGGTVDAMDGDFDTDSVQYKVRHVFGGTLLDPKAAVASKGTGS